MDFSKNTVELFLWIKLYKNANVQMVIGNSNGQ